MKNTITPAIREQAVYTSDFRGRVFSGVPPVEVCINWRESSKLCGAWLNLDLSDEETDELIQWIGARLSKESLSRMSQTCSLPSNFITSSHEAAGSQHKLIQTLQAHAHNT